MKMENKRGKWDRRKDSFRELSHLNGRNWKMTEKSVGRGWEKEE
jgi:hypothetical protein